MRKVAGAALAARALALVRRAGGDPPRAATRIVIALGVAIAIGAGAVALGPARATPAAATKPRPILPVPAAVLRTDLRAGQAPDGGVMIAFSTPMDRASVRAALDVEPYASIRVAWNGDATRLEVTPLGRWASGTYYTITVERGALSASGRPLAVPVRAAFLTRPETRATIVPTERVGNRVRIDTSFAVDFSAAPDRSTIDGGLTIHPPVAGTWKRTVGEGTAVRYTFTPLGRLAADTTYRLALAGGVRDRDGRPISSAPLSVRTPIAPEVVAFRPAARATGVDRAANLIVRFSRPMDRAATEAAFAASVDGAALRGSLRWAERDTVLVFDPAKDLGYEARVAVRVSSAARSAEGVPLADPASARFRTEPRPRPAAPAPSPAGGSVSASGGSGGSVGGSVGSGSWTAVEAYYLRLMNCTRTGGLVTASGGCSSPGGRAVAPLKLDGGISRAVSRPYARLLATRNACTHFLGGGPDDRLRRAGYTSYVWAENLGCRSGDPYAAVLGSHLNFQAERSYNGGHYVNMMNAKYDRAGIGVWVASGRVRLVVDFYHPR